MAKNNTFENFIISKYNSLKTEYDFVSGSLEHKPKKGELRELSIQKIIKQFLPKKFQAGNGFIIDSNGKLSKQCDLIIFDTYNNPDLFFIDSGLLIIPKRIAKFIIEVKTLLNKTELKKSFDVFESVININPKLDSPSLFCIFCYKTVKNIDKFFDYFFKLFCERLKDQNCFIIIYMLDFGGLIFNVLSKRKIFIYGDTIDNKEDHEVHRAKSLFYFLLLLNSKMDNNHEGLLNDFTPVFQYGWKEKKY